MELAEIKDILHQGETKLSFTKVDGTVREMRCTLAFDLIPADKQPKPLAEGVAPKKVNPEVVTMFDLDKLEWRSCRISSILEVNGVNYG